MTVDKIKVKSFQSIKQGEVELGAFTVFTGPSSSGKSAFLRASQALVRNSFTPSQVRMGDKLTEVTMSVDGHEITAKRGKSKSTYVLDGEEFTKSGRSVPEQIENIFKLPQIMEVESTFATQFDKPYLIADPGSVAAKVLGSLTNVSVLHGGLRETNRRSLDLRSKAKVKEEDRERMVMELEPYEDLDSRKDLLREAEDTLTDAETQQDKVTQLDKEIAQITTLGESLMRILNSKVDLEPHDNTLTKLKEVEDRVSPLNTLLGSLERSYKRLPDWDYSRVPSGDLGGSEELSKAQSLEKLIKDLTRKATFLKTSLSNSEDIKKNILNIQDKYDSILHDLDVCPLCNSQIGDRS